MLRTDLYDDGDAVESDTDNNNFEGNKNRFISLSSDEAFHDPNGLLGCCFTFGVRRVARGCRVLVVVQFTAKHDEPICPGLQPEINDALAV